MNQDLSIVQLNCHTEYSIINGILRLKPFLSKVKQFGMQAVSITDQSNLFGMVKFYKLAISLGIKPIIGCDLWLENKSSSAKFSRLTVLCQNQLGLHNLILLISKSYNNWQLDKPLVDPVWLFEKNLHEGLIAIAPMFDSDIGMLISDLRFNDALVLANKWNKLFKDRFYLAVTRVGKEHEERQIQGVVKIASNKIPLVATGEIRFLEPYDFMAHEARVCIHQGGRLDDPHRINSSTKLQCLMDPNSFKQLFFDLPAALINTQEIAKRCNLKLELGKTYLPNYNNLTDPEIKIYLKNLAETGLLKKLNCNNLSDLPSDYLNRLYAELTVIHNMGFAGYFLIVADIIQWALDQGIAVGPGRGSGAGSLVAYALFITGINPIEHGLIFERFLNPERVSMPDFDIDFCINGRDRVIEYVATRYGRGSVAQIITYGTMAAKAAIRDVGRVLGSPYGFVDQIAKLIPNELGMTITKGLSQDDNLKAKYEEDDEVKSIIDLAIKLEGITRNLGKHAGGVVIAPKPIVNFAPLYREYNEAAPVTQFDKNDIEDLGLVKFDFLGLKTLTIIDFAIKSINNQISVNHKLCLEQIPLDDLATFNLLSEGNTIAIFQLESRGMRELTIKLQPSCFEDLIAIGALYRPGPLQSGMVDDFIDRKRGAQVVEHPHPELIDILKPTYGVIVYQEQVMQIAQVLAGYTLGAADLLRRAMGKKKPEEMAKQRKIFIDGVLKLDQSRSPELKLGVETATNIFNLIDKFSGYGFNKSHAAAYALITYQTAWLKTHYPVEFMAAVLSLELGNTDKIIMFIFECRRMGIKVLPPDLNNGEYYFVAKDRSTISYGLGAIKGVGLAAISNIIENRQHKGYVDLLDLCIRVDLHKVSKKTLEALIKSGALDCFNLHRAALLHYLNGVMQMVTKIQQRSKQQLDLFGEYSNDFQLSFDPQICPEWGLQEILLLEKQVLGFYFSNHPLSEFWNVLGQLGVKKFHESNLSDQTQKFAGCIVAIRLSRTKRGDKMAFLTLDDNYTRQEIIIFTDLYRQHKELLKQDQLIIIEGLVSRDHYTDGIKIKCYKIFNLFDECKKMINHCHVILVPMIEDLNIIANKIKKIITNNPGNCPLILHYKKEGVITQIRLGNNWLVSPDKRLIMDLKTLAEVEDAYLM